MSSAKLIIGDVRQVLASLPDDSVDLVLCSPPFLALRSYLPADDPNKHLELGSEPTPGEFIDALLDVVEECRRVLAPHGSLCIELGDTYAGSGGGGGDYLPGGLKEGQPGFTGSAGKDAEARRAANAEHWRKKNAWKKRSTKDNGYPERDDTPRQSRAGRSSGWPLDKSLCLVPELFRISLAYGRNPLTGRETEPWRIRNVIRWVRPNPPVGALGDKFRPATSEMVVACTSRTRYFDLDSVRTEFSEATIKSDGYSRNSRKFEERQNTDHGRPGVRTNQMTHAGAPPLDWWNIPTEPYPGSHYATWPRDLLVRPIKAMCPERVCRVCGEPSRRVVEHNGSEVDHGDGQRDHGRLSAHSRNRSEFGPKVVPTGGWTDCGCRCEPCERSLTNLSVSCSDHWRPGVVLDPFAGSGTTLAVATGHGRDAIGIDLDARNADLAQQRCGMFVTVEVFVK